MAAAITNGELELKTFKSRSPDRRSPTGSKKSA